MFTSLRNYVYDRRRGLAKTAGVVGGTYLVGRYVLDRLEDVRERVMQERGAREMIRKRFEQNLHDSAFTVMAHMPLLGANVLAEMDVEALTAELQALSKAKPAAASRDPPAITHPKPSNSHSHTTVHSHTSTAAGPSPPPDQSPNSGSAEAGADAEEGSESGSASVASESGSVSVITGGEDERERGMAESQTSWVHASDGDGQSLSASTSNLADSITSSSSESGLSTSAADLSSSQVSVRTRSKAELWREVKMLTITRTLTVLYTTTLLTLLTHVQLSLLGRYKYVQAVQEQARAEAAREQRPFDESLQALFFAPAKDAETALCGLEDEDAIWLSGVGEETERRYLTLSWWLLNVGWREVGERVRRAVEEVFEGVPLKSRLGAVELHRLVCDVRRRVEHEVTPEGAERRVTFLSALLPSTGAALADLLARSGGGGGGADVRPHDPAFTVLLEETRDRLASADCVCVLARALDRAAEVLFDGLAKNAFAGPADEARIRLAALLPALARWSVLAVNGLPNELVDNLADVREVRAWAAIIYTGYDERFPVR